MKTNLNPCRFYNSIPIIKGRLVECKNKQCLNQPCVQYQTKKLSIERWNFVMDENYDSKTGTIKGELK